MTKQAKANIQAIIIILVITFGLLATGYLVGVTRTQKAEYEKHKVAITHTVRYGDTLWEIAEMYKPSWEDTRNYICQIQDLNDLPDSRLDVGVSLLLYTDNANTHYTMGGRYSNGVIVTDDGNEWYYDAQLDDDTAVVVTFNVNSTANIIYDDVIINIEEA